MSYAFAPATCLITDQRYVFLDNLHLAYSDGRASGLGTEGMFVGEHGSWNRKPPSGYEVVFVPFSAGRPAGRPKEILTGFLDERGNARGRPVGVAIDASGALLVADDVGDSIWRVRRRAAPGIPRASRPRQ